MTDDIFTALFGPQSANGPLTNCRYSTNACTSTVPDRATTLETMQTAIDAMELVMRSAPEPDTNHFRDALLYGTGISVQYSPLAERTVPKKVHKHRRGQTKAYHARIQKKWAKRFGTKQERCAFVIDPRALLPFPFAGQGNTLVLHPSLRDQFEKAFQP